MAQPKEIAPKQGGERNISPFTPSNVNSRLVFKNQQYNNVVGLPRTARGDGETSEPLVQYGIHLRAAKIAKADLFGLDKCCDNWNDLLFMSIGQKILQNPRFSQYLTKRDRICIENNVIKKASVNVPSKPPLTEGPRYETPPCSDTLTVASYLNYNANDEAVFTGSVPHNSTWKVEAIMTENNGLYVRSGSVNFTGTTIPSLNIGVVDRDVLHSVEFRYTDTISGCSYCFKLLNTRPQGGGGLDEIVVPLSIDGNCFEYDLDEGSGGSGGSCGSAIIVGYSVDGTGGLTLTLPYASEWSLVFNEARYSPAMVSERTITTSGQVINTDLTFPEEDGSLQFKFTDGEGCIYCLSIVNTTPEFDVDADFTIPILETTCYEFDDGQGGGSGNPGCDSPRDPFSVPIQIITNGVSSNPELRVINSSGFTWEVGSYVTATPIDGIGTATLMFLNNTNNGSHTYVEMNDIDGADMYEFEVVIIEGECSYCMTVTNELVVDGAGVSVGVSNEEC